MLRYCYYFRGFILALMTSLPLTANSSTWSDTYISYMYGPYYKYPGTIFSLTPEGQIFSKRNVAVNTVEFNHTSGYKFGTNFFVIRFHNRNRNDPEHGDFGEQGSKEIFGVYRSTFSLPAIVGKKLNNCIIKDFGPEIGFNFGVDNDAISEAQFTPIFGPSISFNVPGFWNLAVFVYKEYNNNRFNRPAGQVFRTTWMIESAWAIDIPHGKFKGFLVTIGPKGKNRDGVGTKVETIAEAYYMFDAGKALAKHKETFYVGVGGQYWRHKYGTYNGASSYRVKNLVISKTTTTPIIRVELHF